MWKKIALALTAFLMVALSACGGGTVSQPDGDASAEGAEAALAELGFQDVDAVRSFVDGFNSSTDGYAYLVESDAQTIEGASLAEQGYSVYRILIWRDKTQGM